MDGRWYDRKHRIPDLRARPFSLTCHRDFPHSVYAQGVHMLHYTKPIFKAFTNETEASNKLTVT
jgi:hypothetical protein